MTILDATVYTLPTIATVNGTFSVYVYSEFAGLTQPTIRTILEIGDLTEKANVMVGISEIGNMTMKIRDDDSTYTEGFWFKILQGECWIRFTLDEGSGATHYFFGIVDKMRVSWDEISIIGSTRIRMAQFTLLSMASKLFESSMDDLITEIIAKATFVDSPSLNQPSHLIKLTELLNCMLVDTVSGLNNGYPAPIDGDVELLYGTEAEIDFGEGVGHYRVDEIYLPVKYYSVLVPETYVLCQYFDTSGDNSLSRQSDGNGYYNNLKSFLSDLLGNFGLIMRMDYDVVTTRHLIKIMHRHNVYSGVLTFGSREKESSIIFSNALIGDAARATNLIDDTKFIWQSKKFGRFPNPTTPDNRIEFDIDLKCIFVVNPAGTGVVNQSIYYWTGTPTEAPAIITGVRFHSTISGAMYECTSSDPLKMQEATSGYQYERFTKEFKTIRRIYGRMEATSGATTSHSYLNIMRRTQIDDLSTDENYFANVVTKKPMTAGVQIEWQEEN